MRKQASTRALPPLDPRQRYSIAEACDYLRISRPLMTRRIAQGCIATITDGRRRFVPGTEIVRLSAPDVPAV